MRWCCWRGAGWHRQRWRGGGEAAQWVERDMAVGRARLGFGSEEAGRLAELHARNFM